MTEDSASRELTGSTLDSFSAQKHNPHESEAEENLRRMESEKIEARLSQEHSARFQPMTKSPDYLASLPTSLAAKLRVTPEEHEEILYHFAATSSVPKTALAARVSLDKVKAVIYSPESTSTITQLRNAMRASVMQKIEETQVQLLEAIQDPTKLQATPLGILANVFTDISQTQINILKAQHEVASGSVAIADPSSLLSGDELEYMGFLRRRLSSPPRTSSLPAATGGDEGSEDLSHHAMNGHEFVDPLYETCEGEETDDFVGPEEDTDDFSASPETGSPASVSAEDWTD